jgi:hypothetical protein
VALVLTPSRTLLVAVAVQEVPAVRVLKRLVPTLEQSVAQAAQVSKATFQGARRRLFMVAVAVAVYTGRLAQADTAPLQVPAVRVAAVMEQLWPAVHSR